MSLATRIKKRRNELNLSITQIAKLIGEPTSSYIEWENGRKITGEKIYPKLALALKLSITELILGEIPTVNDDLNELVKIIERIRLKI